MREPLETLRVLGAMITHHGVFKGRAGRGQFVKRQRGRPQVS